MKIFDTHCHIADPAFDEDRGAVLTRMREAEICRANVVADPCEETPNQDRVFSLVEQNDFLVGSIGVHPHNACRWSDAAEATIRETLNHPKCVLLGEIGLDYHYDLSARDDQRRVFDHQLEMAHELDVSVQLHIREAHEDTMDMFRARVSEGIMPRGIMHCFTGDWKTAKFYLDCGLYISLSGAVTFKNAPQLVEVAQKTPADRLLIETDCPYMSPVPLRGRRNEPSFIVHTLEKIASVRGEAADVCAEQLFENSLRALGVN